MPRVLEPEAPGARGYAPQIGGVPRYTLLSGVTLAPAVQEKVAELAEAFFQRTGKAFVVTSGTRDPARQAEAMHELFLHGADVLRLYEDKGATSRSTEAATRPVRGASRLDRPRRGLFYCGRSSFMICPRSW